MHRNLAASSLHMMIGHRWRDEIGKRRSVGSAGGSIAWRVPAAPNKDAARMRMHTLTEGAGDHPEPGVRMACVRESIARSKQQPSVAFLTRNSCGNVTEMMRLPRPGALSNFIHFV